MMVRSKPIEAIGWGIDANGETFFTEEAPAWLADAMAREPATHGSIFRNGDQLIIQVDDGFIQLDPGDYILRFPDEKLCAFDPETLWEWYEVIDE